MDLKEFLRVNWYRLGAALVLCGLPLDVFAAVEKETGLDMPRDVSLDGHRITWLINITMVFLMILFILMIIWMAIARRTRPRAACPQRCRSSPIPAPALPGA